MSEAPTWERRYIGGIMRHRVAVTVVTLLLTALAGAATLQLRFESAIDVWFVEDDPDLLVYNDFLDRFEADELTVIAMLCGDVFTPDALAALDRITRAAQDAPHVHRVRSLTNIEIARVIEDGVAIGPLMETLPATPDAAAAVRRLALANALLVGGMVSPDATATAVLIELARAGATFAGKVELVDALRDIVAREQGGECRLLLTGTAPFDAVIFRLSARDIVLFSTLTVAVVLVVVFVVFRRVSAALVPLVVVVMTSAWLFGLMAVRDVPVNIMTSGLSAVVLAVSVADSIHVLAAYYRELLTGRATDAAVEESIASVLLPCLFTSLTTAAGMLSLLVSDLQPIREFGVLAALGVAFAFVISVTFLPIMLRAAGMPSARFIERQQHGPMAGLLARLGTPERSRSIRTLAYSAVFVLAMLAGFGKLSVGANTMSYFHEDERPCGSTPRSSTARSVAAPPSNFS